MTRRWELEPVKPGRVHPRNPSLEAAIAEIKRLYFQTTAATIQRDLALAIDLARTMESDEERERVAVYLDGLAQMRREWAKRRAVPRKLGKPQSR